MNPEKFYRISQTQLSIARYYGGCTYNGDFYIYDPMDDSLTRDDIVKKEKRKIKVDKDLVKLAKHEWDMTKELF